MRPISNTLPLASVSVKTAAELGLEREHAGRAWREPEQHVRPPPRRDLAREDVERALRRRGDAQRDEDARRHALRS
jgi:hypothetical protein